MENECEALPGVAYPGVRDNHSTINTKTGYDDDDLVFISPLSIFEMRTCEYCIGCSRKRGVARVLIAC